MTTKAILERLVREGILTPEAMKIALGETEKPSRSDQATGAVQDGRVMCDRCGMNPSFCALQASNEEAPLNTCDCCYKTITGLKR